MSRVPVITLPRSLRTSLALGATLAAVAALGGSAYAEGPPAAAPASPAVDLMEVVVIGATTTGESLQWVSAAEAATPDKPELPEISAAAWLPTPGD